MKHFITTAVAALACATALADVTVSPPPPPKPADLSKTVACATPLVGFWTQTATWTLVAGQWLQSAYAPAVAPVGACAAPSPSCSKIASEFGSFTIPSARAVRFGIGATWVQKTLAAGVYTCGVSTFGGDPAVGVAKECDSVSAASDSPVPLAHVVPA